MIAMLPVDSTDLERRRRSPILAMTFAIASMAQAPAVGQCMGWDPSFVPHQIHVSVTDLEVFDDGTGPTIYAAADLTLWKRMGSSWQIVTTANDSIVSLCVYDDGSGPALYAGGGFTTIGGVAARRIAKWDGTTWSEVGGGLWSTGAFVLRLLARAEAAGDVLYVGGYFGGSTSVTSRGLLKWNGTTWEGFDGGFDGNGGVVWTLTFYDDGTGEMLYAGGDFTTAGGVTARGVAKWNGVRWSPVGSDMTQMISANVRDLEVYDEGNGPLLFAAGAFSPIGGQTFRTV